MQVCRDLAFYNPSARPLVLAIGNFDGVHRGHQALLDRVTELARKKNGIPAVFTFSTHPQEILHPGSRPNLLTTTEQRLGYFHQTGIEVCFQVAFTRQFSELSPEQFVEDILVRKLKVAVVCLGYNARFGHQRAGDGALMRQLAGRYGFEFEEMPPVTFPGAKAQEYVSSSLIRALIEKGDLSLAAAALGRPFGFFARVIRGEGRGTSLGFPTANLDTRGLMMPPAGVYPVEVREVESLQEFAKEGVLNYRGVMSALWEKGVLNFGVRPTFGKGQAPVAEVHILDFKGNLYDRTLELAFYPQLRPEMAFSGPEDLRRQISEDLEGAKAYFQSSQRIPLQSP